MTRRYYQGRLWVTERRRISYRRGRPVCLTRWVYRGFPVDGIEWPATVVMELRHSR